MFHYDIVLAIEQELRENAVCLNLKDIERNEEFEIDKREGSGKQVATASWQAVEKSNVSYMESTTLILQLKDVNFC